MFLWGDLRVPMMKILSTLGTLLSIVVCISSSASAQIELSHSYVSLKYPTFTDGSPGYTATDTVIEFKVDRGRHVEVEATSPAFILIYNPPALNGVTSQHAKNGIVWGDYDRTLAGMTPGHPSSPISATGRYFEAIREGKVESQKVSITSHLKGNKIVIPQGSTVKLLAGSFFIKELGFVGYVPGKEDTAK